MEKWKVTSRCLTDSLHAVERYHQAKQSEVKLGFSPSPDTAVRQRVDSLAVHVAGEAALCLAGH